VYIIRNTNSVPEKVIPWSKTSKLNFPFCTGNGSVSGRHRFLVRKWQISKRKKAVPAIFKCVGILPRKFFHGKPHFYFNGWV
jgi:hypothetical protein